MSLWRLVPAVLLLVIAGWEACAVGRAAAWVPGDAAWRAASAVVRAAHAPGDLIVFAPAWNDPVGRMHLGDLLTPAMVGRIDAAPYARIWELSIGDDRAPETVGLRPVRLENMGGVQVRRFEQPPVEVVADLVSVYAAPPPGVAVTIEGRTQRRPTASLTEVGFEPSRCLDIVPAAGQTATVRFDGVALGTELVGTVGLADVFTRRDVRVPARLEVLVDGTVVADVTMGVDDGRRRFRAPTTVGPGRLELRATSLAPTGRDRHVCVALEARR